MIIAQRGGDASCKMNPAINPIKSITTIKPQTLIELMICIIIG